MARILAVDDEEDILFLVEETFVQAGHQVMSTRDPKRVLPMARSGRFDAIVLDIMMPEVSGWELLEQLRRQEETESTPVVLLSALTSAADRIRGLRGGADDFLTKPFDPDELMARVDGLMSRRKAPTAAALEGGFEAQSIHEVLQQLVQSQKSGRLDINRRDAFGGRELGQLRLHQGNIIDARHRDLRGEEAVLSLLDWRDGRFRFHPNDIQDPAELSIPLQPLLIHSAWIDDELAKRTQFLPEDEQPLRWTGPDFLEQPENIPTLPIEIVRQSFSTGDFTLKDVVQGCNVAARRLKLAIAWFREQGFVETQAVEMRRGSVHPGSAHPGNTTTSGVPVLETATHPFHMAPEDLDMAIRELQQSAIFRRLPHAPLQLHVLVDRSAWKASLRLLKHLPSSLGETPYDPSRDAFSLHLDHPAGPLHLEWSLLERQTTESGVWTPPPLPSAQCTAIGLWLAKGWTTLDLSVFGRLVTASAPASGLVLVSSDNVLQDLAHQRFGSDTRWRVPTRPPASLAELFLEMAQTDPVTAPEEP